MDLGLKGKKALVVGGSKSIGLQVVKDLKSEGCEVLSVGRSQGDIKLDITNQGNVDRLIVAAGVPDIIVHAVGGSNGIKNPLGTSDEWNSVWRLNLGASIDINRAFIPSMIRRKWGRIVHISSHSTQIHIGYPPYTSAKHALEGYVKTMGREFGKDNVIISAVRCGPIFNPGRFLYSQSKEWTEEYIKNFVPMNRFGEAEEVSNLILFLCSEKSTYMSGSIIDIDGVAR